MRGYGGRILYVDVTSGRSRIEPVSEEMARSLLGGNGFAARLMLDHVAAGIDPYDPADAVVFAVGPITDTTVSGNSRACVASKSPLTDGFFDSTFGGRFPATMKRTGFDAIVITGRAVEPVYLEVTEAGAELRSARALWGHITRDTVHAIQAAEGADTDVMAIGPAGEHLVRFAAMGTYWKNREGFAGRGGIALQEGPEVHRNVSGGGLPGRAAEFVCGPTAARSGSMRRSVGQQEGHRLARRAGAGQAALSDAAVEPAPVKRIEGLGTTAR